MFLLLAAWKLDKILRLTSSVGFSREILARRIFKDEQFAIRLWHRTTLGSASLSLARSHKLRYELHTFCLGLWEILRFFASILCLSIDLIRTN